MRPAPRDGNWIQRWLKYSQCCWPSEPFWHGATIYDFRFFIIGLVLFVLVSFVAPFLLFSFTLRRLRIRGDAIYGRLSCDVCHAFEKKWLNKDELNGRAALEVTDFSATT